MIVSIGIAEALYQKRDLKRCADFLITAVRKTHGQQQLSLWLTLSRVYLCEKVLPMALETANAWYGLCHFQHWFLLHPLISFVLPPLRLLLHARSCKKFPESEEGRVLRAEIHCAMGRSESAETELEGFIRTSKPAITAGACSKLLEVLVDLVGTSFLPIDFPFVFPLTYGYFNDCLIAQ
jgi:hypothetical protein